mmetsp:Transcript_40659/g.79202  ORF Transcript_40659/g.79202 Transcript_40659/m.79202 type:complete len:214 (-) Transcript_40659:2368-3009(-)
MILLYTSVPYCISLCEILHWLSINLFRCLDPSDARRCETYSLHTPVLRPTFLNILSPPDFSRFHLKTMKTIIHLLSAYCDPVLFLFCTSHSALLPTTTSSTDYLIYCSVDSSLYLNYAFPTITHTYLNARQLFFLSAYLLLNCNYSVHSNHHSTAHAPQLLSTVLCTLARLLLNFVYYSVLSNPPSLKCTLLSCDYQSTTIQPTVRDTFDHTC